jgi:hypothetical protein
MQVGEEGERVGRAIASGEDYSARKPQKNRWRSQSFSEFQDDALPADGKAK